MFLEHSLIVLLALLSLVMFWTKSPFMSLMYAVIAFINSSVVLFMLGFSFLAIVNLIIYVGALAVLFLFVIMLLEIPSVSLRAYYRGYSVLALTGFIASKLFFFSGSPAGAASSFPLPPLGAEGGAGSTFGSFLRASGPIQYSFVPTLEWLSSIGYAFYIRYADLLILNSLVLTIALFGALVLAHLRSV